MNSTDFEPSKSNAPRWRDWTWQAHPLIWVYPASLLVAAAPLGAKGLSVQTARLLCWLSAIAVQVFLCPRRPVLFGADDPSSRMMLWPLGLWQDGHFANLWRLAENGSVRIFRPVLGNLFVTLVCAISLGVLSVQISWNPFVGAGPWNLDGQEIPAWSALWWIGQLGHAHWILTVAAIVPAMPLAGGFALALLLDRLQWVDQDSRRLRRIVAWASVAFLALLGSMLVARDFAGGYCVILVALVIGLEARHQAKRDATEAFIENFVLGVIDEDDFEAGLDRLDKPRDSIRAKLRDWYRNVIRRRAAEAARNATIRKKQDEIRLDELLSRIHEAGYRSLGFSDRRFLRRISREIRDRRDPGGFGPPPP